MRRKLILVLVVALVLAAAMAVPPAAGTQIKNQAVLQLISTALALRERFSPTR